MNLHLKTKCYELTITLDDCCGDTEPAVSLHPDNLNTLFPANPNNRFDDAGLLHNGAIEYSMTKEQPGDSEEQILAYIDEFIPEDYPFTFERPGMKKVIGPGDGTTIFYPPIPDLDLNKEFLGLMQGSFDPTKERYADLYERIVGFEEKFMASKPAKDLEAEVLIRTSILRHSRALWTGVGIKDPVIVAKNDPVTQADVDAVDSVNLNWSMCRQTRHIARASRRAARAVKRAAKEAGTNK